MKNKRGFTLIELMVTVAIIGLFAAVIFPSLESSRAKSRDAVRMGDLKSLSLAAQSYFVEHNGAFPSQLSDLASYFKNGAIPADPSTHNNYNYIKLEHGYCLGTTLETDVPSGYVAADSSICSNDLGNYVIKGP